MTALTQFQRLESVGLWRDDAEAQRREVVLILGEATLVIRDAAERPLTHWSLPAIERLNPGEMPALFSPDSYGNETVEIDDQMMVDALEKIRKTVDRSRPHPHRLRTWSALAIVAALIGAGFIWLPDALIRRAQGAISPIQQTEISAAIIGHVQSLTGPACRQAAGTQALETLRAATLGAEESGSAIVLRDGPKTALPLPGNLILLHRDLIEYADDAQLPAGYILVAEAIRDQQDPLAQLLNFAGFPATVRLLTTGHLPDDTLRSYAEHLLTTPQAEPDLAMLRPHFNEAGVSLSIYWQSAHGTPLPRTFASAEFQEKTLLSDEDWLNLQGICG